MRHRYFVGTQYAVIKIKSLSYMLLNSLKSAANGLPVFRNQIHQYLNNRHQYQDPLSSLKKREFEVLREIANGLKNREISKSLFISEETVKVHIRNLLKNLMCVLAWKPA
ncbi:Transcriptional regulatory protein LiaR [Arsenophonus endosymbiont of Bemisia tabaci Q2]|nr:Transcriptional regulatory protein LiaR [Arsenophonus endosymbiont of Bemisia tabaci Q2]